MAFESVTEYNSQISIMPRIIDDADRKILTILQKNSRVTNVELAKQVGLAPSAVLERVRKLEQKHLVRGYTAILDPKALGYRMLAFVAVRTAEDPGEDRVARSLARLPEVLEVHHVAGEDCFLVKLRARDAEHIGELLKKKIGRIPGVRSTRTTIVLGTEKETSMLPVLLSREDEVRL